MARGSDTISQRIALEGGDEIKKQLADLGKAGEGAIRQIQDATQQSGSRLAGFSDAVGAVRTAFGGLGDSLGHLRESFGAFREDLEQIGKRLGVELVVGAGAAATALLKLAKSSAESIDETQDAARNFGLTIPQYQALQQAAAIAGEGMDTLNAGLSRFTASLGNAQATLQQSRGEFIGAGTAVAVLRGHLDKTTQSSLAAGVGVKQAAQAASDGATILRGGARPVQDLSNVYSKLGIALADASGRFKAPFDLFKEAAVKINGISDAGIKGALASEVFGRGWAKQLDILSHLAEAEEKVNKSGRNITTAEREQADAFRSSFAELQLTIKRARDILGGIAGTVLVPIFEAVSKAISNNFAAISQWASGLRDRIFPVVQDVTKLLSGRGDEEISNKWLLDARDAVIGLGNAAKSAVPALTAAFNLLKGALDAVAGAINLVFGTQLTGGALALLAIIGQLTGILPVLASAFSLVAAAVTVFWRATLGIATLTGWPAVLIAGLAALAAAIGVIILRWDDIKKAAEAVAKAAGDAFTTLATWVGQKASDIWQSMQTAFDQISGAAANAVQYVFDWFTGLANWVGEKAGAIIEYLKPVWEFLKSIVSAIGSAIDSAAGAGAVAGFARGGAVRGPGSATSDSIPAWLSAGEFVVQAAAVRHYGQGVLHALNNMILPLRGFRLGGLVDGIRPPPLMLAPGSQVPIAPAPRISGRPFSIVIDGHTFSDLIAPEDTANRMARFARSRQLRSAGRKPGWFGG
jgi:phage-related protein